MTPGELAEQVYQFVPDQALYLETNAPPETVVQILMESDFLTKTFLPESSLGPGIKNPDLQDRCDESDFYDRLTNLTLD